MRFLYDPHTHTSEVSPCGWMEARHVIDLYHQHGYQGLVVTDHLHEKYIQTLDCRDDWQACVDAYMKGYYLSKQRAEELHMDAIFGVEIRFPENDRDFLLFGVDENFLRRNPFLYRMSHQQFYERFSNEVLIIQAHPYRDFDLVGEEIKIHLLHGLEVYNGNPRHDNQNDKALALLNAHKGLVKICGSDTHRPGDEARAALAFPQRIRNSFELKQALEEGRYDLQILAKN